MNDDYTSDPDQATGVSQEEWEAFGQQWAADAPADYAQMDAAGVAPF